MKTPQELANDFARQEGFNRADYLGTKDGAQYFVCVNSGDSNDIGLPEAFVVYTDGSISPLDDTESRDAIASFAALS